MSNEAVRIKKRNDIASRISTYLGVIIFEDWRKYL